MLTRILSAKRLCTHKAVCTPLQKRNMSVPSDKVEEYDVVVVGSGMAGACLATTLGKSPLSRSLKMAIIDSAPPEGLPEKLPELPDLRVFSINPASTQLFKAIGAWEKMKNARVTPYHHMHVCDGVSSGKIDFSGDLGHIIEQKVITGALVDTMKEIPNLEIISDKIGSISFPEPANQSDLATVSTSTRTLSARIIVGADGANSFVRKQAGIETFGWNYNQKGVVATIRTNGSNDTAFQRFLPTGPIAFLPLHDNYASIVWSTNAVQADQLLKQTPEQFLESLNHAFSAPQIQNSTFEQAWNFLGDSVSSYFGINSGPSFSLPEILSVEGPRAAFPLKFAHVNKYVQPRLALIGDAGHSIHPMAGQGINLGFADVVTLTHVIQKSIETGTDIGSIVMLEDYSKNRTAANIPMMLGVDALKHLFGSKFGPAVCLRSVGLGAVNKVGLVKDLFKSQALGNFDLSKIGDPQYRE
eukprot:TRINITY_DN8650_c0_g1_i1.p1 TRINITY_DN8650_c0_g1~~TRINITY_DN8650_c0_g1_i1.p1  ORF type:complete len:471 (-),score=102.24 TRINITY_DN8650_c0_g1_i1:47-1459(-)